jgi:succinoglycan biosynthesis transport protein ExoP
MVPVPSPSPRPRWLSPLLMAPPVARSQHRVPTACEAGDSILEYWELVKSAKWQLLFALLVGVAAGFTHSLSETAIYDAKVMLEIQPRSESNPVKDPGGFSADATLVETQMQILQSRSMRVRASDRLRASLKGRVNTAERQGPIWAWVRKMGTPLLWRVKGPSVESAVQSAAGSAKARIVGQTRVVEVTCEAPYALVASEYANALVTQFIEEDVQAHRNSSKQANEWLAREVNQLKVKLEDSQRALQSYAQQVGLTFTTETATTATDGLRRAQEGLERAMTERVARQARFEMAANSPAGSLPDVLDDSSLRSLENQLTELKRQRAELLATFTPAYFKAKNTDAQIVAVEAALVNQRTNILERIRNEYDESRRRESMFVDEYHQKLGEATSGAQKAIRYAMLKREVDANSALYQSVLQRANELDLLSAIRASNIRVFDQAIPAKTPNTPKPGRDLAFGMMGGLLIGFAVVFLKDQTRRHVNEPGEVEAVLSLPELGVIPCSMASNLIRGTKPLWSPLFSGNQSEEGPVELVTWQQRPSMMAESFRALLASILFSGEEGGRPQVIVVTSPNPGEGKSTVASNLAIALAEIQHRVLLIDSDMRNPRLHRIFSVENSWGLTDLLQGGSAIEALPLAGLCRGTEIPRLWLLPSGPATTSVSHILFSERVGKLIGRCRNEFQTVIVDTAPVLHFADARALGKLSDGVILVVRAKHSRRDAMIASADVIARDGTPIIGTVLNDWTPRRYRNGVYDLYPYYHSR